MAKTTAEMAVFAVSQPKVLHAAVLLMLMENDVIKLFVIHMLAPEVTLLIHHVKMVPSAKFKPLLRTTDVCQQPLAATTLNRNTNIVR